MIVIAACTLAHFSFEEWSSRPKDNNWYIIYFIESIGIPLGLLCVAGFPSTNGCCCLFKCTGDEKGDEKKEGKTSKILHLIGVGVFGFILICSNGTYIICVKRKSFNFSFVLYLTIGAIIFASIHLIMSCMCYDPNLNVEKDTETEDMKNERRQKKK